MLLLRDIREFGYNVCEMWIVVVSGEFFVDNVIYLEFVDVVIFLIWYKLKFVIYDLFFLVMFGKLCSKF